MGHALGHVLWKLLERGGWPALFGATVLGLAVGWGGRSFEKPDSRFCPPGGTFHCSATTFDTWLIVRIAFWAVLGALAGYLVAQALLHYHRASKRSLGIEE